jgi:hypothetical protein
MSQTAPLDIAAQVREVTDDEVSSYQENGWVSLPGLMSRELAGEMLSRLKALSGLEYDELPRDHPDAEHVIERVKTEGIGKLFFMSRLHDDTVYDIVSSGTLGEASARLTGTRPMRLFTDGVICKLPGWTTERGVKGGINTGETPWHQDFSPVPWDRAGGVQFWLALCEITPEMGSMQHLSGSHREPPLGCAHYTSDQTLKQSYPELWDKYELSPAHHFQPGDVLAHNPLTVHYAQANKTDKLRWVYTSYRIPAETLYNGIPNPRFTEFGFEPWKPFEHPKFPIVAE